jgi:hypothetical protein
MASTAYLCALEMVAEKAYLRTCDELTNRQLNSQSC